jgi:hypothetical protein
MSGLSASTYSWGGEAGLLGGGGDEGTFWVAFGGPFAVPFGAGLKYRARPVGGGRLWVTASSSVVGGDDSSELSLADISVFRVLVRLVQLQGGVNL